MSELATVPSIDDDRRRIRGRNRTDIWDSTVRTAVDNEPADTGPRRVAGSMVARHIPALDKREPVVE